MSSTIHILTPAGWIKKPSYSAVATWVKESWDEVNINLIQKSFKCCGISTEIDGSEDQFIFDYDKVLDEVNDNNDGDDEVVENLDDLSDDEYSDKNDYVNDWNVEEDNNNNLDNDENNNENNNSENNNKNRQYNESSDEDIM